MGISDEIASNCIPSLGIFAKICHLCINGVIKDLHARGFVGTLENLETPTASSLELRNYHMLFGMSIVK